MSAPDSPCSPNHCTKARRACPERIRRDGWTVERQLRFLDALVRTRSVAKAAKFAGMSRESAYRLRNRREGALFAALWNCALVPETPLTEVHAEPFGNGRLMRLLGSHFRRKCGNFQTIGSARPGSGGT